MTLEQSDDWKYFRDIIKNNYRYILFTAYPEGIRVTLRSILA